MQTRRLYYEDCHLRDFSATVTGCTQTQNGWEVTLDATAFYPEGGGQACDAGVLGGANVLDVQERNDTVVHLCDKPLEPGQTVSGRIDWDRRFDLMQQHTGEHILSGLIHAAYGYHNVGFHMGREAMEIDFDGLIPTEALAQLEARANQAVWEDIPLHCWYPEREQLSQIPYRTKKALDWPVRIVQVPGYDTCACCGVHVARTGEVGPIKILSCVKFRQGVRLELLCGRRAFEYMCRVFEQNRQVSQQFSAKPLETAAAARRVNDQLAAEKYRADGLQKQIFAAVAAGYAGKGDVAHFQDSLLPGDVRELADRIAQVCGGVAAVFSGTDEAGYSFCLIGGADRVKTLGDAMTRQMNGRGGGKPGSYQGSLKATRQQIEGFLGTL